MATAVLTTVALIACSASTGAAAPAGLSSAAADQPSAAWTMLLYANADTNIEAPLLADLVAASTAGSTKDVNIIVLVDRTPDETGGGGLSDGDLGKVKKFDDAKLLKIEHNDFTEIQDMGELDMGNPQTLAWFIATGIAKYPAKHYGLALLDHGGGASGFGWDDTAPKDGNEPSHLTISEMGDAMAAGLKAANVDKFDVLGFHACLLGTYDLAVTVAPYADYLLSSEEVMWGETWDWAASMQFLDSNPKATAAELGKVVVDRAVQPGFPPIVTMSLIDLRKIGGVQQAVGSFADALVKEMPQVASELGRQRNQSLEFGKDPGQAHSPFALIDLGDLTRRLTNVPQAVGVARSAVFEAIKNAVVQVNNAEAAAGASGLSIYFPPTAREYRSSYDLLASSTNWRPALKAYYANAGAPAPDTNGSGTTPTNPASKAPKFESPNATIQIQANGVLVSGRLVDGTEASAVAAQLVGGITTADGSINHLLFSPASIGAGDVHTVSGGWGFTYTTVSDGKVTLDTTTFLEPTAGGVRASIPMLYQGPDGKQDPVSLEFAIDSQGKLTEQPRYIRYQQTGGVAELRPEPGSLIAPLVFVSMPGAGPKLMLISDKGLDATVAPQVKIVGLAKGTTFNVVLLAYDAANNVAVATATGVVP